MASTLKISNPGLLYYINKLEVFILDTAQSFRRLCGYLAILAGPLALASLIVGLSVVSFNFDTFSDHGAILSLGASAANTIRWSWWLSMCGSYLFLVPLALWLGSTLQDDRSLLLRWYTLSGLGYLALGAAGAAILAAAWPLLMTLASTMPSEQQTSLLLNFTTATAIAEDGLQGVLQNLLGSVWFLGIGSLLWQSRRLLAGFTCFIGTMLVVTLLGAIFASETLSLLGLTATILLVPVWSVWIGVTALRSRP